MWLSSLFTFCFALFVFASAKITTDQLSAASTKIVIDVANGLANGHDNTNRLLQQTNLRQTNLDVKKHLDAALNSIKIFATSLGAYTPGGDLFYNSKNYNVEKATYRAAKSLKREADCAINGYQTFNRLIHEAAEKTIDPYSNTCTILEYISADFNGLSEINIQAVSKMCAILRENGLNSDKITQESFARVNRNHTVAAVLTSQYNVLADYLNKKTRVCEHYEILRSEVRKL